MDARTGRADERELVRQCTLSITVLDGVLYTPLSLIPLMVPSRLRGILSPAWKRVLAIDWTIVS